jgi:hypothetical protein
MKLIRFLEKQYSDLSVGEINEIKIKIYINAF